MVMLIIKGGITQPTPNYNTSMLEDMFLEENSEFVRKVFLESRSLVEALILLKVWFSLEFQLWLAGYLFSIYTSVIVQI